MRPALAALAALAAACSPEPAVDSNTVATPADAAAPASPDARAATETAPALAIEAEGLRLFDPASGSARPLPFGTPQAAVMTALAHLGQPETNRLEECGAGPLDAASWPAGPTLYFQDSKFAGWALREEREGAGKSAITTASGIGIGSTRAELDAAYQAEVFDSSLGTEFSAGELFGLLDGAGPAAKVTNLWAGAGCIMR